jgi:mono/diheme cytochrome c family protein
MNKLSVLGTTILATIALIEPLKSGAISAVESVEPSPILLAQNEPDPAVLKFGKKQAARKGCAACHSVDGKKKAGPTWLGLFGSDRVLADGTTVFADEDYLRQSILDPNVVLAEGFSAGLMPMDYEEKLKQIDLAALIEYIKSLK